jgi:hypothetical protein
VSEFYTHDDWELDYDEIAKRSEMTIAEVFMPITLRDLGEDYETMTYQEVSRLASQMSEQMNFAKWRQELRTE